MKNSEKDLSKSIGYFRLSTSKQLEEYHSFDAYMDRFLKFGFKPNQIYHDIASGSKRDREGYQKILQLVKNDDVDKVYIPEISRISRNIGHFQEAIEAFKQSKVELITLDGHKFDFDTPTGALNVNLQVLFAENTRLNNQYRALQGHKFLRQEGRAIRPVFPYIKPKDKLIPNTAKYKNSNRTCWEVGRELIETFIKEQNLSLTIKLITVKYGEKSGAFWEDWPHDHSAFRDWLRSQSIRGNLLYFGGRRYKNKPNAPEPILVYNTHEALITEEEARTIELIINIANKTKTKSSSVRNLWVGKLFCECGAPMKISTSKGSTGNIFHYVVCKSAYPNSSNIKAEQALGLIPQCSNRSAYGLTLEKLEEIVIDKLCRKAQIIADIHFPSSEEQILPPEVIELNNQIQTYTLLALDDPDLNALLEKKIKRREYLLGKEKSEGNLHTTNLRNKLMTYGKDREFWMVATPAERKILYGELIKKIVCSKGSVEISFLV